MRHWTVIAFAFACASMSASCTRGALAQSSPPRPVHPDAGLSRAEVSAPANALCLPLVSDDCGCVYDCGIGWNSADGGRVYEVHHRFWDHGHSVMHARVA